MKLQTLNPVVEGYHNPYDDDYDDWDNDIDIGDWAPPPLFWKFKYQPGTSGGGQYSFVLLCKTSTKNKDADDIWQMTSNLFANEFVDLNLVDYESYTHGAWIIGYEYYQFNNPEDNKPEMVPRLQEVIDDCQYRALEQLGKQKLQQYQNKMRMERNSRGRSWRDEDDY